MSGKTPGQAAREAFLNTPVIMCACTQVPELPPCEHLMAAWEAAAQAAIAAWQRGNAEAALAEPDALDDLPAVATAGTEHLAAELAERGEG